MIKDKQNAEFSERPRIVLTMGDVNGIGPEILVKVLRHREVLEACRPLILGDVSLYKRLSGEIPGAMPARLVAAPNWSERDAVQFLDLPIEAPPYRPGCLDARAGACAMQWLERGVGLALEGAVDALVTCPITKEGIHLAGYDRFQGHTDFIAEKTGAANYRMCLFAGSMRVVHITGHLALREALAAVKKDRILETIRVAQESLVGLGISRPRIGVAGLNPHAGESGAFGREEIEEISPAVEAVRAEGVDCSGPYSPDTVLGMMRDGAFDGVIAMYHDQGHIPMKLIAMDEGVNVTLGIPIIRTSPDHGTAYDIAGKNIAREASLRAAIQLAAEWASQRMKAGTQERLGGVSRG